jgi:hypothetical protein
LNLDVTHHVTSTPTSLNNAPPPQLLL